MDLSFSWNIYKDTKKRKYLIIPFTFKKKTYSSNFPSATCTRDHVMEYISFSAIEVLVIISN